MSEVCGFIDDGYVEGAYICAEPLVYPALRFEYRPLLQEEQYAYWKQTERLKDMELRKAAADLIAKKLVSWDLKTSKGEPVKIEQANLIRLKIGLFNRLMWIVTGGEAGDDDPSWPEEKKVQLAADRAAAAVAKKTVAEVRAERDAGNSPTG